MTDRIGGLGGVLDRARDEAAVLGSKDLEAEHILLALTGDDDPIVRGVLSGAELDRDAVRRALEVQDEAALAGIGVSRAAFGLPPTPPLLRTPGWSTSAKQALVRAKDVASAHHSRSVRPPHVLLALLRTQSGTVPRALAAAGVDSDKLAADTEKALGAAG